MSVPDLTTVRLVADVLRVEHAAELFPALLAPELYTYIPVGPPESLAALTARYERLVTGWSPDGLDRWLNWVMRERATGAPVGLLEATVPPDGEAYLAYSVFPAYWRRGYAREGCVAMMAYLRQHQGATLGIIEADAGNAASIGLAEALGFRKVGEMDWPDGRTEYRFVRAL